MINDPILLALSPSYLYRFLSVFIIIIISFVCSIETTRRVQQESSLLKSNYGMCNFETFIGLGIAESATNQTP